ncbi:hypothetical protein Tco_1474161 [Tanacetum coccineum]
MVRLGFISVSGNVGVIVILIYGQDPLPGVSDQTPVIFVVSVQESWENWGIGVLSYGYLVDRVVSTMRLGEVDKRDRRSLKFICACLAMYEYCCMSFISGKFFLHHWISLGDIYSLDCGNWSDFELREKSKPSRDQR